MHAVSRRSSSPRGPRSAPGTFAATLALALLAGCAQTPVAPPGAASTAATPGGPAPSTSPAQPGSSAPVTPSAPAPAPSAPGAGSARAAPAPVEPPPPPPVVQSQARTVEEYQREFAQRLHALNRGWVHQERPQALLRAVVVGRIKVERDGTPRLEFMRRKEAVLDARASASVAAARGLLPPRALATRLAREGFTETWLFNTDGRFVLRTLALPQDTELRAAR